MQTVRAKVEAAKTAAAVASALHGEFGIDRLSIARFGPGYFEIVAAAGKSLLVPGQRLPTAVSTQLARSAAGQPYAASSFVTDFDQARPIDQVMLTLGFRSGCSIPIGPAERPTGAVSLSSTIDGLRYDRVLSAIAEVQTPLLEILADSAVDQDGIALVCNDDDVIGAGFARLLEDRFALVARVAPNLDAAIATARAEPVRLILCSTQVCGLPADRLVELLRSAGTAAPVVVVSTMDTTAGRRLAARAGAVGYVPRRLGAARVLATVSAALQGRTTLPDLGDEPGQPPPLTRREIDVLLGLDEGLSFRRIARRHGVTENTARSYARTLFRKLDAHSRSEAVANARRAGLLAN